MQSLQLADQAKGRITVLSSLDLQTRVVATGPMASLVHSALDADSSMPLKL